MLLESVLRIPDLSWRLHPFPRKLMERQARAGRKRATPIALLL